MADTAETDEVLEIEDQDDLALVKRMQEGRDKIVAEIHPVAYGIKRLYRRFLYWDKFGYPEYMVDRFVGNYESIFQLWWFDPEKAKILNNAMDNDEQIPVNEIDVRYWSNWNKNK